MNIFVLDNDPIKAAEYSCDKHVVKMIVESCQMLSSAHRVLDGQEYTDLSKGAKPRRRKRWRLEEPREDLLWKASFVGHPCTQWIMQSKENYRWLARHAVALTEEYTIRYEKKHSCESMCRYFLDTYPDNLLSIHQTEFAQAMPEQYKVVGDAVQAYRNYYHGEKAYFAKWKTTTPHWWNGVSVTV